MLPLTTKSSSLYIACRVYAVLGILAFWAGCVYGIYEMLSRNQFSIFMLVAVFLGVPAILMVLNWAAFPFHYSAFGHSLFTLPTKTSIVSPDYCPRIIPSPDYPGSRTTLLVPLAASSDQTTHSNNHD